jgi:diguanylate cyclase (GGDEF)-like protein
MDGRLFDAKYMGSQAIVPPPEEVEYLKDAVCLEISERHEIRDTDLLCEKLILHRKMGCRIAVDDFGAGFSSLKLLYFIRPEYIKIDRFYIQDIEKDANKRTLASSIVKIAHLMGGLVIAEGVETEMEYYCCKKIGCDLLQGYLVQKPQLEIDRLLEHYDTINMLNVADRRNPDRKDASMIKSEIVFVEPIEHETRMIHVLDMFKRYRSNTFFPVVNHNDEPLGILCEDKVKEFAYSEYGRHLLANPTFDKSVDDFTGKIPVVDIHTPVEQILETFSINENLEGILITNNMKYMGFLSAHSLIKILNEKNLAIARDQNPLTKLPGNDLIYEYVSKALQDASETYSLVYFDFDNFKAYNDKNGFRQGDRVILLFAEMLKKQALLKGRFAGHLGGDDFFMGVMGQSAAGMELEVRTTAQKFRENVESFYDADAINDGCIKARDRDGQVKCFPLITVSAALLELPAFSYRFYSPEEISNTMADMKKKSKTINRQVMYLQPQ